MMSNKRALIAVAVVVVVAAGLSTLINSKSRYAVVGESGGSGSYGSSTGGLKATPPMSPEYPAGDAAYDESYDSRMPMPTPMPPTAGQTAAEVDQKIIKNGYLSLVVDRVGEAVNRITALASAKRGFVQSSSVSERGDGTQQGSITLRVPSYEFESAMTEIKGYAAQVKSETASGQDVTEQYTDLEAQLRNAKAQEEVYLQILKKAQNVKEILEVQSYLGNIRQQIESLEGRLKYLENLTSYSTITVSVEEEPTVRVPTKEFRPLTAVRQAAQAVVALFQLAIIAAIWFVIVGAAVILPLWLLAWVLWKLASRFMRR